jgi:hypothetical protein
MNLEITYPETHEAQTNRSFGGCTSGTSATRNTPAKILVSDKNGNLIPCNYQSWYYGDDDGVGGGNHYVPSGEKPIDSEALEVIKREFFESESIEKFHEFIRTLMHNPPAGVQFIRYDGNEKVVPPQEYWTFLGIKIAKERRATLFIHSFSLCRLQSPLDKEYEASIAQKKQQVAEKNSNLERLKQKLSLLSLGDYLRVSGQNINAFNIVSIEHNEEEIIPSCNSLPPIDKLLALATNNFLEKAPDQTECVVAMQREIVEISPTFWVQGKQRVTYQGLALVPKKKSH